MDDRLRSDTGEVSRTMRGVLVAFALALARAPPGIVLCGQGADELFLGYAHFRGLSREAATARADSDLRQLVGRDWPRTQQIAQEMGRSVAAPFLHPDFVRAARSVPIESRLPHPVPKGFFRAWAAHRGVPEKIAGRPKRAVQFGSGVDRLIPRK
jgi:asparagine synthase (glutamine-hydrolysing)